MSDFKYYQDGVVHKLYPCAIFDLYYRRIVSYRIRYSNDNFIVIETFVSKYKIFIAAFTSESDTYPLCLSDRGFQYTGVQF